MREIFYGDSLPPSGIRTRSLDLLFQWHLATDIQSYFLFKLLLYQFFKNLSPLYMTLNL